MLEESKVAIILEIPLPFPPIRWGRQCQTERVSSNRDESPRALNHRKKVKVLFEHWIAPVRLLVENHPP